MDAGTDPGPLKAYQLVMAFAARRGEAALRLALHAALPQVLRADLLHLMRLNFLPETVRELAVEADVLFAPFCEDLGNGYYRFAGNARLHLLQGLDPAYRGEATARSVQVARFMLDYLDHEQRNVRAGSNRVHADWIEVERWSALGFVEPSLAAGQLAAALAQATADEDIAARVRVAGLAATLATPLARFGELLAYAAGVEALEMGRLDEAGRVLGSMADREVEVAGIRLQSPRQVLAGRAPQQAAMVEEAAAAQAKTPEQNAESPLEKEAAPTAGAEPPVEDAQAPARDQVYISYSHRDQKWAERIAVHLIAVTGAVRTSDWSDAGIGLGEDLRPEIAAAIARARVAVVLVSPDYLGSDFLMQGELSQLIAHAQSGDLRLTWLCVRPCDWSASPLARYQAAYDPTTALAGLSVARRDSALAEITKSIAALLDVADSGNDATRTEAVAAESKVIFIVYRRDDTASHASRLRMVLRSRLSERNIFIEFADISPGEDFHQTIGTALGRAAAVLVVIGTRWLESRDADGRRRLDDPEDAVRLEIATALRVGAPVVPVLVGGAVLPSAEVLPEELARLVQFNAVALRDAEWDEDCSQFARDLERYALNVKGAASEAPQEARKAEWPARIYLLSTATDLGPEREAAANALRHLGHQVVGAEFYGALDTKPLFVAFDDIAKCDVVVCIVARRYGYVPQDRSENPDQFSFVELEYREARRLGKPILTFQLADDAKWDPKAMDAVTGEAEQGQRIMALRQRLAKESMTEYFRSVEELTEKLIAAVALWNRSGRGSGEVLSNQADATAASTTSSQSAQQAPTTTSGLEVLSGGSWMPSTVPASHLSPGTVFRDGSDCPEMVVIPAGEFMMGSPEEDTDRPESERPQRMVTFAHSFAIGRFEVTFDEWDACVAAGGCSHNPEDAGWGRGKRPVINVNWDDAQAYARWLSQKTGRSYRLLSEAEWEYAARGGTTTRYPWGEEVGTAHANFRESGSKWSGKQTAPVGSFGPNAFGLCDMIGNVLEWVEDCWNHSYLGAPQSASPWESGDCGRRVVRGGHWGSSSELCRSAIRDRIERGFRNDYLGFRLARTLQVSES